jgi:hypothetical protein
VVGVWQDYEIDFTQGAAPGSEADGICNEFGLYEKLNMYGPVDCMKTGKNCHCCSIKFLLPFKGRTAG